MSGLLDAGIGRILEAEFQQGLRQADRAFLPTHVVIACMPKSGSTFLCDVISQAPGFRRAQLYPSTDRREQELDEFCLQQVDRFDYVAQCHVRYSEWTADMCRSYRLKPVVLVRSLLDVIVSLRDHVRKQSPVWPMFFAEPFHADLDDAQLELMLARLATPWYVNFYMSWRRAPGAMMISYEQLIHHPEQVVGEVLAFAGAPAPRSEVAGAIERVRLAKRGRLNVGVAGRGAGLRPETIRAVLELIDFYPQAAQDPYIQALTAQAQAALGRTGGPAAPWPASIAAPPPASASPPDVLARRWIRKKAKRFIVGRVLPVVLVALAVLYWRWPNDLINDAGPMGYVDDGVVMLVAGFLAGRLAYRGAQPRLRRARR